MNNMIRVMVRKGLVTDLARIPHSLDLSSPNMAGTINAALKPLELVSRIVNLPSFVPTSSSKKKYPQHDDQQPPIGKARIALFTYIDKRFVCRSFSFAAILDQLSNYIFPMLIKHFYGEVFL